MMVLIIIVSPTVLHHLNKKMVLNLVILLLEVIAMLAGEITMALITGSLTVHHTGWTHSVSDDYFLLLMVLFLIKSQMV